MRFVANLGFLFKDPSLLKQLQMARAAGYQAVELAFSQYDYKPEEVASMLKDTGLTCVLINAPPGDAAQGDRGFAAIPGKEDAFWESFQTALTYAKAIACSKIHLLSGVADVTEQTQHTFVQNFRRAADEAQKHGVTVLGEAICRAAVPGYFLHNVSLAASLIEKVSHPHARLQLDIYHLQMTGGNLVSTIERCKDIVAHVQIAGVPGRNEPHAKQCEYRLEVVLAALRTAAGYDDDVGCEYTPTKPEQESLRQLEQLLLP